MIVYLVELLPVLKTTGAVQSLRYSSSPRWTRAENLDWLPRLRVPYRRSIQVFDGAFSDQPQSFGTIEVAVQTGDLVSPVIGMAWDGRRARVWKGNPGEALSQMVLVFDGECESVEATKQGFTVNLRGPGYALTQNMLTLYDGSGDANGTADIANTPRPMALGKPVDAAPVYVDKARGIFQYHGYGTGVLYGVYDGGSPLTWDGNDYADYAALKAASIAGGYYTKCSSLGMGRHGGSPITNLAVDAAGLASSGLIGDILTTLGARAGVPVDAGTAAWLNTNLPHPQDNYVSDQTTYEAVLRDMMLKLGGYTCFTAAGQLSAGLVRRGAAPTIALGRGNLGSVSIGKTAPPYYRRRMGYQRAWKVHSLTDVRTPKEINARGTYAAGTAYAYYDLVGFGADTWLHIGEATTTGTAPAEGAVWTKFGSGVTKTSQLTDDASLGLTALWPNVADPNGARPKDYADVTATNTAAAITGQAPAATDPTIQTGATNDTGGDTRETSFSPLFYRTYWLRRLRTEFKKATVIGAPTVGNDYGTLETYASWGDPSGGPVWQRYTNEGGVRSIRVSQGAAGNETWGSWQAEFSGFRPPAFGGDITESLGGPFALLNLFKTQLGISSGFAGQGSLATLSQLALGSSYLTGFGSIAGQNSLGYGSSYLTGFGALAPLGELFFGSPLLRETSGGTSASLNLFKTPLGIASGFAGQGSLATLSQLALGSSYLTGFGSIAGQNSLGYGSSYLTGFGSLSPLSELFFGSPLLREVSGGGSASLTNFKTILGTASAITGQAPAATDPTIMAGATNDRIADTRSTNQPPSWYRANATLREVKEFKFCDALGVPDTTGGRYGTLYTTVPYGDATGGLVQQRYVLASNVTGTEIPGRAWVRSGAGTSAAGNPEDTWGPWQAEFSELRKPAFGGDITETLRGTPATLGNFKTIQGVSSGFTGQGSLATLSSVTDGYLGGNLASRLAPHPLNALFLSANTIAYNGGAQLKDLQPQEAGANATEGRTSAAFTGQTAWATFTGQTSVVQNLTNNGQLQAKDVFLSGVAFLDARWPQEGGSNVTETRVSSAFTGQSSWATYTGLVPTNVAGQVQNLTTGGSMPDTAVVRPGINFLSNVWPAQAGADKTGLNVASAITGQAPAATDSSIQSGATNDRIPDVRSTNQTPGWYRANYPKRQITEFKQCSTVGINSLPGVAGNYGSLTTTVDYEHYSGGSVKQRFVMGFTSSSAPNGQSWVRASINNVADDTWGPWQTEYSELRKPAFGGDLTETTYGTIATLVSFKTSQGISSGFAGQGSLATKSAVSDGELTGLLASRVSPFAGDGNYLDASRMAWNGTGGTVQSLKPQEGGANVTEGRTSAAVTGQGSLATRSTVEDGYLGGNLATRLAPHPLNPTFLSANTMAYVGGAQLKDLQPLEAGSNKTETRTAAAITGQAPAATDSSIMPGATNDRGTDNRNTQNPPSYYRLAPQLRRVITEFMQAGTVGVPNAGGSFGTLESYAQWQDPSGGSVWQRYTDANTGRRLTRNSSSETAWGVWQAEFSEARKPTFGADVTETLFGSVATLGNFKTSQGVASAITGQSGFATASGLNPSNMFSGGFFTANAFSLNYTITRSDGVSTLTESLAVTQLGIAAGFAGQGGLATRNNVTFNDIVSTGVITSYNGQGGRVERDGNGERVYYNNGQLAVKIGF